MSEITLNLGSSGSKPFLYSLNNLKKHFISLGSSGSGKTVLTKVLIEECALQKVPSIVIDVQGDLSSLILHGDKEEILKHNLSEENYNKFKKDIQVNIFTPISSKGIPISINPLKLSQQKVPEEEIIPILHSIANAITKLLGYSLTNDKGKSAEAILYTVLKNSYDSKNNINSFDNLANLVDTLDGTLLEEVTPFISNENELKNLVKKIKYMTVGEKRLLFQFGVSLDIDLLLGKKDQDKKTNISVIYLNTLNNQDEKEFFITNLTTELYQWMLSNPSDKVQCAYVIDEIAPYIPATSEKPMTKSILNLLFKQARKYGISCIIATQNPGDIDYKAFAQFGSWAIGRLSVKQDIKKVENSLKTLAGAQDLISTLPKLQAGEFLLFAPDISKSLIKLNSRWLYTQHKTLNEEQIKELTKDLKKKFEKYYVDEVKPTLKHKEQENKLIKLNTEKDVPGKDAKLFFHSLNYKEAMDFATKKRKKMFWLFGPALEDVLDVKESLHPFVMAKVGVKESFLGISKPELNHHNLFFDGTTGDIIKATSRKHKHFTQTSKLLNLTDNQLSVARAVMMSRKPISVPDIVRKTHLSQATVSKALTVLLDQAIVKFKRIDKYKQWFSLNPFKKSRINYFSAKPGLLIHQNFEGRLPNVNVATKDISQFVRTWFKNSQMEEKKIVYLPIYRITYTNKKGKIRTIQVNGATKKYQKLHF